MWEWNSLWAYSSSARHLIVVCCRGNSVEYPPTMSLHVLQQCAAYLSNTYLKIHIHIHILHGSATVSWCSWLQQLGLSTTSQGCFPKVACFSLKMANFQTIDL